MIIGHDPIIVSKDHIFIILDYELVADTLQIGDTLELLNDFVEITKIEDIRYSNSLYSIRNA